MTVSTSSPPVLEPATSPGLQLARVQGLSEAEASLRRKRGQGNTLDRRSGYSYVHILRQNFLTFINTVLFSVTALLAFMGRLDDAFATGGLVLFSCSVSVIQEVRAKRAVDRIAVLTRPVATVVRDGIERQVDPAEIVVGDSLIARSGDQIMADGVVEQGSMEVDEALLTGESDLVAKSTGSEVYSGSFCMSGAAAYAAQRVGTSSLANRITSNARAFRKVKTVLQRDIDTIIRVLVILASSLLILFSISVYVHSAPIVDSVRMAAVIVGLVPQGLLVMIVVSYALGAARMAGKGAIIQRANAVESMSHVDVLCLDKTGTITTGDLQLRETRALSPRASTDLLAAFAAGGNTRNRTTQALGAAYPGAPVAVRDEVVFSSLRQWSGLTFDSDRYQGSYILGAPEVLAPFCSSFALPDEVQTWTGEGLRVLLFARGEGALHDPAGKPVLPPHLHPLFLLAFADCLRPDAKETLGWFREAGVDLKVISGDSPETVAALARQAGFQGERMLSGAELASVSEVDLLRVVEETSIFGRITPPQKEQIIRALRAAGHYVGMVGDGVNDVPAMHQAQLGIALAGGSQVARSIADIVLLEDSFSALPRALGEGQRIIRGMQSIMRLLLSRTVAVALLCIGAGIAGVAFPITPKNNAINALLTVGVPTLGLATWARYGQPPRSIWWPLIRFVLPAGLSIAAATLTTYLLYLDLTGDGTLARTMTVSVATLCGIVLIVFAAPPVPALAVVSECTHDWRPAAFGACMALGILLVLGVPTLQHYFEVAPLRAVDIGVLLGAVSLWAAVVYLAWRGRLLERLIGLERAESQPSP